MALVVAQAIRDSCVGQVHRLSARINLLIARIAVAADMYAQLISRVVSMANVNVQQVLVEAESTAEEDRAKFAMANFHKSAATLVAQE
jgi:hypothetical protein